MMSDIMQIMNANFQRCRLNYPSQSFRLNPQFRFNYVFSFRREIESDLE